MEDLNFDLVVFSPYRSLTALLRDAGLGEAVGLRAWTILNDSYRTDVSLLHPPHMVALACVQLATVHLAQQEQEGQLAAGGSPGGAAAASLAFDARPFASTPRERPEPEVLQRLGTWMGTLNVDLDQVNMWR